MTETPKTMIETPGRAAADASPTPLESSLSALQLDGAIFFRSEFTEAWSFTSRISAFADAGSPFVRSSSNPPSRTGWGCVESVGT